MEVPRHMKEAFKISETIGKILELLESEGLTKGEVEKIPHELEMALKRNSEKLKKSKPFTVYKED